MKFVNTHLSTNAELFLTKDNLPHLENIIEFATQISEQNAEESMKKTSVATLKKMIEAYSGITVDMISKKRQPKSDSFRLQAQNDPEKQKIWQFIIDTINTASLRILKILDPRKPIDGNSMIQIFSIHGILITVDEQYKNQYLQMMSEIMGSDKAMNLAQQIETFLTGKMSGSVFKSNLLKLIN